MQTPARLFFFFTPPPTTLPTHPTCVAFLRPYLPFASRSRLGLSLLMLMVRLRLLQQTAHCLPAAAAAAAREHARRGYGRRDEVQVGRGGVHVPG